MEIQLCRNVKSGHPVGCPYNPIFVGTRNGASENEHRNGYTTTLYELILQHELVLWGIISLRCILAICFPLLIATFMTFKALPFVILTGFLFGSTLIASRFSVGQFHPLNYISFRLLLASSAHILIYLFSSRSLPRDRTLWIRASIYGVFGTAVNLVGIVSALQFLSSGLVAILLTTAPAITALFAHFALPEERLGIRQWLGIVFALSGAVLLALAGENGLPDVSPNPIGYILAIVAILSGAIMTIYARQKLQGYDSFDTASIRMWVASITIVPFTILFIGFDLSAVTSLGIFAVIYAGLVGTFSGFLTQLYTITRFGAVPASMVTYVIPLVTGIGGVLLLGETFTPTMIIAIVIITTGITLVQREKLRAKSEG